MENIGNTSDKKTESALRFNLNLEGNNLTFATEQLKSLSQITSNHESADYFITSHNNSFKISDTFGNCFFTSLELLKSSIQSLIRNCYKLKIEQIKNNDVEIRRINKFISHNSLQNNIIDNFNKAILSSSDEIIFFLRNFFSIKELKHFNVVHLFVHEKGQSSALQLEVEKSQHRTYSLTTTDFSAFFLAIKKSKNRSFGQQVLKGFNFNILGTFLAHEFSLKKHNVILILSRNDFLGQTKTEIDYFNFLSTIIPSFLEILLDQMRLLDKIKIIKSVLRILTDHRAINQADIFHHERVSLLGELLNTLRHELSNPLFGLQLTSELLLLDTDEAETDKLEMLTEILKSIKRSQKIIENFTRLYKGSEEVTQINVIELLEEVFTLTKSESRNIKKSIIWKGDNLFINSNPTWLAQIFFNLIINSSQAFKNSSVAEPFLTIEISLCDNRIIFNVIDNGPGVPPDKKTEIFKPFYTTKSMGTGLGLAIARNLAEKLRGDLSYIAGSAGAHFKLELPYENLSH